MGLSSMKQSTPPPPPSPKRELKRLELQGSFRAGSLRRKSSGEHQSFDSQIDLFEKYVALAHKATQQGDRVLAESYYQHAEHALKSGRENQE